ncbi:unnamed protein product, partial [Ectocarpus sp. 4 AP-2014]
VAVVLGSRREGHAPLTVWMSLWTQVPAGNERNCTAVWLNLICGVDYLTSPRLFVWMPAGETTEPTTYFHLSTYFRVRLRRKGNEETNNVQVQATGLRKLHLLNSSKRLCARHSSICDGQQCSSSQHGTSLKRCYWIIPRSP